ncbi:MAG: hypothetical protein GY930_00610 [bacterium]|nr:hypothetical protein [bacterium]
MSDDSFDDDVEMEEGDSSPFNIRVLLLYGAWRSKHWIALCALLGMVGGLVAAASMPNVYQSMGRMDYRPGANEAQTMAMAAGVDDINVGSYIPGMGNELMILDDLAIYMGVAKELGPAYVLGKPDPTAGDEGANIVTRLWHGFQKTMIDMTHRGFEKGNLVTEKALLGAALSLKDRTDLYVPVRTPTSIITVFFDGYSEVHAQKTLEAILKALKQFHRDKYKSEDFREIVRENYEILQGKITSTDEEIQQHQRSCGYLDLEGERTSYLEQKSAGKIAISGERVKIANLESRLKQTREELEDEEPMKDILVPAVTEISIEYRAQQSFLLEQKRLLAERRAARGVSKGDIKALEHSVKENERILNDMERLTEVQPARMEPRPNDYHNDLTTRKSLIESELAGARSSMAELEKHVKTCDDHLESMGECRELHRQKLSELTALQYERAVVSKQLQASENQQALVDQGHSALMILSEATLPRNKTGPKRIKPLGTGIMAGLAIGMFLAILRQLLDPTVRYRETLEKELDCPVLTVVPETKSLYRIKPSKVKAS